MKKFSIIVPVYNVEKYLGKCLDSVNNQTFKDYEVIVINDGSTDNSISIIEQYKKNNYVIINQENKGLSEARNTGLKIADGEYIFFLDSDDYIKNETLEIINNNLLLNPDILRFQVSIVNEKNNDIMEIKEEGFSQISGEKAFNKICKYHFVENAWCYVYRKKYLLDNDFFFKKGIYHEDYALIPYVIINADNVISINSNLYYYVQRDFSIMNNFDYNKTLKKVNDFIIGYDIQYKLIEQNNKIKEKKIFKSFIANSLILKGRELNNNDLNNFIIQLKERRIFNQIIDNNIRRKIKKIIMKKNLKLYYKIFIR